jgi:hypothetical protein
MSIATEPEASVANALFPELEAMEALADWIETLQPPTPHRFGLTSFIFTFESRYIDLIGKEIGKTEAETEKLFKELFESAVPLAKSMGMQRPPCSTTRRAAWTLRVHLEAAWRGDQSQAHEEFWTPAQCIEELPLAGLTTVQKTAGLSAYPQEMQLAAVPEGTRKTARC